MFDSKEIKEINMLYDAGAILKDLANRYNCCIYSIHKIIINPRKQGAKKGVGKVTKEMSIQFKKLYSENKTTKEIGEIFKVSSSTVKMHINRF